MALQDSACAELGGNINPQQKRYARALGVPPNSVGAQSDASTMKVHRFAMSNLAKAAIQTIHLSDRNPQQPMHSMMLICLDEVHKRKKHKEGGRISYDHASVPRLTILAHDSIMKIS